MASVVTVADVERWSVCRRVVLAEGVTITNSARRWLAERQIVVELSGDVAGVEPAVLNPDDDLEEVRPEGWVPQVMAQMGVKLQTTPGESQLQRAVITVLGKDRVGIIAAITTLLSERQINVLDINQTLFGDLFSMNMAVHIGRANCSFAETKKALEQAGEAMQLKILVQREAVFDYMHRV